MYFFASKIVKNRSDQNKNLKLWRICEGNIFSPLAFCVLRKVSGWGCCARTVATVTAPLPLVGCVS